MRPGKGVAAAAAVVLVFVALAVLWMRDEEPPTSGGTPVAGASDEAPTADATTAATGGGSSESEPARCPASGGHKPRTAGMPLRADVDGEGRDELFIQKSIVDGAEMGTGVLLGVFVKCELQPLLNEERDPYVFPVGESDGVWRGVGCVSEAGARHLVGLEGRDGGNTVAWSRTTVEIDGNHARNADVQQGTFERGRPDDAAIELFGEASCGENTFDTRWATDSALRRSRARLALLLPCVDVDAVVL